MKKFISTSAIILFIGLTTFAQDTRRWYTSEDTPGPGFSKDIRFEVRGKYERPVKKEVLNDARFIRDFVPYYPVNWIADYVSAEILVTSNGKTMKAVASNDVLSAEQKNILNTADLASDIVINVNYKYKNSATDHIENGGLHVSMTVVPEIEAEYVGGDQQMRKYLKENLIKKISDKTPSQFQKGTVIFTVNENGEIVHAKISKTSGDSKTDKLLLDGINKMPKWRPAENSNGIKVKQDFLFSIYSNADGC